MYERNCEHDSTPNMYICFATGGPKQRRRPQDLPQGAMTLPRGLCIPADASNLQRGTGLHLHRQTQKRLRGSANAQRQQDLQLVPVLVDSLHHKSVA